MSNWWIVPQHCLDPQPFKATLEIIRDYSWVTLSKDVKNDILDKMIEKWLYKQKKEWQHGLGTSWHKIDEPHFYWWLFISKEKLHISNYGKLLLDNWDDEDKKTKVFSSMLFSVQYPNMAKARMPADIKLFPFRILFQYLIDYGSISLLSFTVFFYKLKEMKTEGQYENLVNDIQIFEKMTDEQKLEYIKYDKDTFVKNQISAKYCMWLLNWFWIIKKWENISAWKVQSSKRKDPTPISTFQIELNSNLVGFIQTMLSNYSIFNDVKEWMLPSELAREIYNFVAPELLEELNVDSDVNIELMTLPDRIIETSINSELCYKFEDELANAFNIFVDVDAEKIWGASQPDIVCNYVESNNHVFTADAKSTKKKLSGINRWRITWHKEKHGWEFSIIITPKRVPAAEWDIIDSDICLLSSYAFSDLIKIWVDKYNRREEFSFADVYSIIKSNLWEDITPKLYEYIDDMSGIAKTF